MPMIELDRCPFCGTEIIAVRVDEFGDEAANDGEVVGFIAYHRGPSKGRGSCPLGDLEELHEEDGLVLYDTLEELEAAWNRRAERTCTAVRCEGHVEQEGFAQWLECSQCEHIIGSEVNYCPGCGAKIEKEGTHVT